MIFAMEDTRKGEEKKKNTKLRKVHDLSFDALYLFVPISFVIYIFYR